VQEHRDGGWQKAIAGETEAYRACKAKEAQMRTKMDAMMGDFEDAVQYENALRAKATAIVTRDPRHYRNSEIPVLSPETLLASSELK
jgi:hypothetical protein